MQQVFLKTSSVKTHDKIDQNLTTIGLSVTVNEKQQTHKAVFLDMSVDAPARCQWLCMKQFNGYHGCGKCKEPGQQLQIEIDGKKRNSHCHIYPFNAKHAASTGHAAKRKHDQVKKQAKKAMENFEKGESKVFTR